MGKISSARARGKLARSPLLALALCACGGAITEVPPGQAVRLRVGESARVSGTSLVVTFRAVLEDSRCAIDVVCVWAGNGQVELGIRGAGGAERLTLNTTVAPRESRLDSHRVRLQALRPAPLAGRPIPGKAYEIDLLVTPD